MDYEQFSQDVTATAAAKRVVDEFAKKQVDGVHICPRCGRMTVKERLVTNPYAEELARRAGLLKKYLQTSDVERANIVRRAAKGFNITLI